jgi:RHS repeat-associated protein
MRSNNQNIEQIWQFIRKISIVTKNGIELLILGIDGKQSLASLMICLLLLPLFALPAGASVSYVNNDNSRQFEPVNEQLSIWTETWRNLNAKIESWATPLRSGNTLVGENDDDKKKKGKKNEDKDVSDKKVENQQQNQTDNVAEITTPDAEKTLAENETASNTNNLAKSVKKIETRLPKEITTQVGQSITLSAIVLDKKANVINGVDIYWESSDAEILKVQGDQASAIKEGVVKLTVKAGNISKTFDVKVAKKLSNPVTTPALILDDDEDEYRSNFSPQNNLGAPSGQVEAQASSQPVALRNALERPGSSNFSFDVPVAALPGRGIDAGIDLTYNSRVWNYWSNTLAPNLSRYRYNMEENWLSPGFNLSLGKLQKRYTPGSSFYILTSPDGTRHELVLVSGSSATYESNDGTFIKMVASTDGSGNLLGVLTYSDGTIVNFSNSTSSNSTLFPNKITDNNGNTIEIAYQQNDPFGHISYIKDTLSRYIKFYYDSGNKLVAVTVPAFNSSSERQTIRFYYETMNFNTTVQRFSTGATPIIPASVSVLKYVYFPGTQTGYKYDYSSGYGMIYKVSDLRGMQVSSALTTATGTVTDEGIVAASTTYNYPLTVTTPLPDVPNYTSRTDDWVNGSSSQSAVTTYQIEKDTTNNLTKSKITSPDGTITETWAKIDEGEWDDGLVTDTFVKTLISSQFQTYKTWAHSKLFWGNQTTAGGRQNPRVLKTELTNEADQTKATAFDYDGYNNQTQIIEYDFAPPGQVGTELRKTDITYETTSGWINRRILHLPITVKKTVNSTIVSRTDFEYDNYGTSESNMTARSDIAMFDQTYNPASSTYNTNTKYRGNFTKVTAFSDATLESDSNANVTNYTYDIAGNPVSATLSCCQLKTINYGTNFAATGYAYPVSQTKGTSPTQLTTSATYDYNTGLMVTSSDENQQATSYEYETDTLRQKKVIYPNGSYVQAEFSDKLITNENDLLPEFVHTTATLDSSHTVQSYSYFNGRGQRIRSAEQTPDGWSVLAEEYDQIGRPVKSYNPFYVSTSTAAIPSGTKYTEVLNYDAFSRTTSVKLQDDTTVSTEFSDTSTTPSGFGKTFVTITDQSGKKRRQVADSSGRIVRVDEPDVITGELGAVDSPNQPTSYEYDGNDNLSKVTQSDGTTTQERLFKYDSLSRLTHEKQVEANATLNNVGVKVTSGGLWTKVLKYDSHGLLTEGVDARGVKTAFSYDGLNRVSSVVYTDETGYQTPTVTYTYDQARNGFFNNGALTRVETAAAGDTPATATEFDYDLMGRTVKQRQSIGSQTYNLEYGYNLAGQLVSEKYPSGKIISINYDANGRLSSIADSARTYAGNFQFQNYGGALSAMSFGNGMSQTFVLNDRLLISNQTLSKGSEVVQQYDYEYGQLDSSGNMIANSNNGQLAKIESHIGTVKQWTQKFSYDSIGRLSEAKEYRGDTNALSYKQKFDFDRFGNLYRKNASNPTTGQETPLSYTPIEDTDISKSKNRFTSDTNYDEAGNVVTDNKFRLMNFNYDANGRMVKASKENVPDALSVYDASGMRVAEKVNDTWRFLIYDIGGKLVSEYGGLQTSDEGGVKYVLSDRQGSTRAVLSNTGLVQARIDYQSFGEEINPGIGLRTGTQGFSNSNNLRQRYGLTERDEATGLDNTLFRRHENRAGRWTSPDPYNGSMDLINPQSFNRYSYVESQPTNFVDPSGLIANIPERKPEIYWWGPGSGRTRSYGQNRGGGISSSGHGGRRRGAKKTICNTLAANSKFNKFAKEMWEKGSKNEASGLFGEEASQLTDGTRRISGTGEEYSTYKIYSETGATDSTSTASAQWKIDTVKADKDIIYTFSAHTHPPQADGKSPLYPSTEKTNGKGNGDTVALTQLKQAQSGNSEELGDIQGVIIIDKKFAVYGIDGKVVCTGAWE